VANLVPSIIGLDKGLNLQTAKLIAPAGSVLDTLNYEQVDFQGQKRIDGFARYDGSLLPALDEYYVITLTDAYAGTVGDLVATDAGLFGVVVGNTTVTLDVAVINNNLIPVAGETLYTVTDGANVNGNVVVSVSAGVDVAANADTHYNNLLTFTEALRNRIEELPGPIAGLHWFRDRLYAVAGVTAASLSGTTPVIYPNDILTINGNDFKVLDSYVLDNTRLVFLNSLVPAEWQVEGTAVTRDGDAVGTIANGYEDLTTEIASFFESRSEAQVLEEDGPSGPYDFGWRFVDQGWEVLFENGISLYGSLPSLNQNIIGLGTQGPTSITGSNGRPLLLVQKVTVAGKPTQVNGWKSTNTPDIYDLDADDVAESDSDFTYADAFISWDGDTGAVSAPGLTSATLTEYPATATVEVEV
jgi:hypothetical protein